MDDVTDNTHDLEDALRALKDRPSMEHELACLRECNQRLTEDREMLEAELTALRDENLRLVERNQELVAERDDLRREVGQLRGREIGWADTVDGWKKFAEKQEARAERLETALRAVAGHQAGDPQSLYRITKIARSALDDGRGK